MKRNLSVRRRVALACAVALLGGPEVAVAESLLEGFESARAAVSQRPNRARRSEIPASSAASAGRALLLVESPGDRPLVDELWAGLLRSSTGRALAAEFSARGRTVRVRFEDMSTREVSSGGRTYLDGGKGYSTYENGSLEVALSSRLREPRWRALGSSVLAHELLGHCARYASLPQSLPMSTYHLFTGDETYASLVGHAVALELGERSDMDEAVRLARSRSESEASRLFVTLAYAQSLSLDEMSAPAETYRRRAAIASRELAQAREMAGLSEFITAGAAHFVSVHGEPESAYAGLRAAMAGRREAAERAQERFSNAASWLGRLADRYATRSGAAEAAAIASAAGHPFFAQTETRIRELSAKVLALAASAPTDGPAAAGVAPDSSGVTESELLAKVKADAAVHPEFWSVEASKLDGPR